MLGLVGSGLLSQYTIQDGNLQAKYDRFARNLSPDQWTVHLQASGETAQLQIDQSLLQQVQLQQITPQPSHVSSNQQRVTYTFDQQGTGAITVNFYLQPQSIGPLHGTLSTSGGRVELAQFVYP